MPQPLLSALFSASSLKITNASTGMVVLLPIRTIRVGLMFPSKVERQQMEDGSTKIDQRTILPIGITIDLIAPTMDVVGQVNAVTADRESTYIVSARGLIIEDMRVSSQDIKQEAENLSSTPIRLTFMQAMFQGKSKVVYLQPSDASLIDRGATLLTQAVETVEAAAAKVASLVT